MEHKFSLRPAGRPNTLQACRSSLRNPSTVQAAWSLPMPLPVRPHNGMRDSRAGASSKIVRPHTAAADARVSSRTLRHSVSRMEPNISLKPGTVRHPDTMPDCWAPSRTSRPQTAAAYSRPPSLTLKPQPEAVDSRSPSMTLRPQTAAAMDLRPPSISLRPHTAAAALKCSFKTPMTQAISRKSEKNNLKSSGSINQLRQKNEANSISSSCPKNGAQSTSASDLSAISSFKRPSGLSTDPAPIKRLQSVKSYSSPRFSPQGFSAPESPKQSVFDARLLKHPEFDSDAPKHTDGMLNKSRVRPNHYVFDPSLNLRSPSISADYKVDTGPTESLVTEMPLPPEPSEPSTQSTSPSQASRMLRRKIEAALRMFPRNTWGPVTKWGYQEDLAPGKEQQKDHFIKDNDKLEKQRLDSRRFGHKRHWVKFKNVTNFWEQQDARQSAAYTDEKNRFLTDAEKMLHAQNDKRISRAKRISEAHRAKKRLREFKRLEKREGEYIEKRESEQRIREDPRTKANDSGVMYNIVTLEYPNNYAGDLLRFEDDQIRWRQCMRALRIQSKQSGSRFYNPLSWKPVKPCCVPPAKPEAPNPPDPALLPSPRKPELPLPKNMLHLLDTCVDVPIGCTNDNRTNW